LVSEAAYHCPAESDYYTEPKPVVNLVFVFIFEAKPHHQKQATQQSLTLTAEANQPTPKS